MLDNYKAYYIYTTLINEGKITIKNDDININTWHDHYNGIFNILKDGIETDQVQHMFITIDFGKGITVDLNITDYYFNLSLWYSIIALDDCKISPKHLFFKDSLTKDDIKKYIDKFFIEPRKTTVNIKLLNNIIANTLERFIDIDEFAMFLSNTLNLEDSIELMQKDQNYYNILHADLSGEPLDNVKNKGMELVEQAKAIIKNAENIMGHEHCLKNAFISKEGIKDKQYKDNSINIGTKPDGRGSIYHNIINRSYITGGLNDLVSQYIDSATARVAQIIGKKKIGSSVSFARILELNNCSTFLHRDPNFDCGTNNYTIQTITNKTILNKYKNRYYKLDPNGPLYHLNPDDDFLIGQTIYIRTPMYCVSHANGEGICYHCCGDLAYVNNDISIARIAAENITEQYIQLRLGAKHQLDSSIKPITWSPDFDMLFEIDVNFINLKSDIPNEELEHWNMIIDLDSVQLEKEEDFFSHKFDDGDNHILQSQGPFYNEYITKFDIVDDKDNKYTISGTVYNDEYGNTSDVKFYITSSFAQVIRNNINIDDESNIVTINLEELVEESIFLIKMENNDLGKNLDSFVDLINKQDITKQYTADELLERMLDSIIKGEIEGDAIQLELLIANQIRSVEDRLKMPNWRNINEPYELLTLDEALVNNPSPLISLTYNKLARVLTHPITFKKFAPSVFDPFFMRKPKKFINIDHEIIDVNNVSRHTPGESPVVIVHDHEHKEKPLNVRKFLEPFRTYPKTRLED